MESNRRGQFLIACRYVPYDQWFLTHINKSWKIKHLKQSIVAKVLNHPFDRRHLVQGAINARPPSPITFASDDSIRPISPIEFAGSHVRQRRGGLTARRVAPEDDCDEDATFTDHGRNNDAHLEDAHVSTIPGNSGGSVAVASVSPAASPTSSSTVRPGGPIPGGAVTVPVFQEEKDQILTDVFTLIRFTTGQILEDNFLVSWYDLRPHELVELHASSPPATFSLTIVFRQLLVNGGTIDVDLSSAMPNSESPSNSELTRAIKIPLQGHTLSSSLDLRSADSSFSKHSSTLLPKNDIVGTKLSLTLCNPPILTYLPRHDPVTYAQPYWEGWIRVLRVVIRSDVGLHCSEVRTKERLGPGISSWAQDPLLKAPEYNSRRTGEDKYSEKRYKTKKEWRERWAVIRDGFLNLCRDRTDMMPTHRFPLSALTNLTGAEYLATHVNKDRHQGYSQSNSQPGNSDGSGKINHPSSSRRTASRTGAKSASVSHARSPSSRRGPDADSTKRPFPPISSASPEELDFPSQPPTPSTLSPSIRQMNSFPADVETLTSTGPLSTRSPPDPTFSSSAEVLVRINHELSRHQRDKFDRERAALRELERESERKIKEETVRMKKEVESIMRWDDLGIFSKSKGKEKDKRRRMGPSGHKERGEREQKAFDYSSGSSRHPFIGTGDKVKDKKDRERDRHEERHRGKDPIHQRERSFQGHGHNDRWYIPSSPEDAKLAGMWIVCARFRSVDRAMDLGKVTSTPGQVHEARYASTGPSLASDSQGHAIDEAEEDEDKDDREWRKFEPEQKEAELRSQPLISSDVPSTVQSVLTSRKSSLPSLGLGLTMLNAGSHGSGSSSSLFGGIFGSKDKEKDGLDRRREREQKGAKGKDRETGDKAKEHCNDDFPGAPAMGSSPTSGLEPSESRVQIPKFDAVRDTLTIDTSAASHSDLEEYLGFSSPSFAPNTDSDVDDILREHRKRHHHGTPNTQNTEQRIPRPPEDKAIEGDKGEWIVLDLGTDIAYNSFLRILHRHFLPPIQTSFVDISTPQVTDIQDGLEFTPTQFSSPSQPRIAVSQFRSSNTPLALPYPEWRNEIVHRARSEGMLECGRPLELTLHDWRRQSENMSLEFRKQMLHDEQWRNQLRMGFLHGDARMQHMKTKAELDADGGLVSNAGNGGSQKDTEDEPTARKNIMDDNHISSFESMVLEDSEHESEDESARWWKDIPRQLLLREKEGKQEKYVQVSPEVEDRVVDARQSNPTSPVFSNPFSSSGLEASESSRASSTTLSIDAEGRFQPSLSATRLASNFTSSSARSVPFNASPLHSFKSTFLMNSPTTSSAFLKTVTKTTPRSPQEEKQRYLEQRRDLEHLADACMDPTTLAAVQQDDGGGESSTARLPVYPHDRRRMPSSRGMVSPSQALSPSSEESLVSLRHSQPHQAQSRSFSPDDTFESNIIQHQHTKSLLHHSSSITNLPSSPSLHRPPRNRTVSSPPRDFETQILTPAQIHQIESEIEAQIAAASDHSIVGSSPPYEDKESKPAIPYARPTAQFGPDSDLAEEWTQRPPRPFSLGPRHTTDLDLEDGSLRTKLSPSTSHNRSRKPTSTSPSNVMTNHPHSTLIHKSSISAKAVLRRVRSGSSLQIPLGIHFEDMEENEV